MPELKNIFSIEEFAWLISECIIGLDWPTYTETKNLLLNNIEIAPNNQYLVENREGLWRDFIPGKINEVEKYTKIHTAVLDKVRKLPSFHVYCFVRRITIALDQVPPGEMIEPEELYKLFS